MNEGIEIKLTRYSESQILAILRQAEGGVQVAELCREHGMAAQASSLMSFGRLINDTLVD
jgi:putative transposase